jgi:hypothetical protein
MFRVRNLCLSLLLLAVVGCRLGGGSGDGALIAPGSVVDGGAQVSDAGTAGGPQPDGGRVVPWVGNFDAIVAGAPVIVLARISEKRENAYLTRDSEIGVDWVIHYDAFTFEVMQSYRPLDAPMSEMRIPPSNCEAYIDGGRIPRARSDCLARQAYNDPNAGTVAFLIATSYGSGGLPPMVSLQLPVLATGEVDLTMIGETVVDIASLEQRIRDVVSGVVTVPRR